MSTSLGMVYMLLLLVHQPAFTPSVLGISLLEVVVGTLHIAAAAGGEDVECLAAQVVSLGGTGGREVYDKGLFHFFVLLLLFVLCADAET